MKAIPAAMAILRNFCQFFKILNKNDYVLGESNYRSGKGSSRSFGDDFGPKKPRFSSYENWGKDDDLIKVEPTLIDKKFNFWNLPKSARILLVRYYPYIT